MVEAVAMNTAAVFHDGAGPGSQLSVAPWLIENLAANG
jgi:hypothetical protein